MENNKDDTLDFNVDDLFDVQIEPSEPTTELTDDNLTKAMSDRINTVRKKTESETQDKIAKELGYENYADFQKAKEQDLLKEHGLDEEEITSVVNKLVEQRMSNDPRFKKLEELEALEKTKFVETQLREINTIAGTNYKQVTELPKDTLEAWEKLGDLSQAFYATHGAKLIGQKANRSSSTSHMAEGGGSSVGTKRRLLTEEEKAIYRMVNPDLTEEELSKKTKDIDD